jgi:hypothetical protein
VLSRVHPSTKISLSALSVVSDLTSYVLHTILRKLKFVPKNDVAKVYVREAVRVDETVEAADNYEIVFAAQLASAEGDQTAASVSSYVEYCRN